MVCAHMITELTEHRLMLCRPSEPVIRGIESKLKRPISGIFGVFVSDFVEVFGEFVD